MGGKLPDDEREALAAMIVGIIEPSAAARSRKGYHRAVAEQRELLDRAKAPLKKKERLPPCVKELWYFLVDDNAEAEAEDAKTDNNDIFGDLGDRLKTINMTCQKASAKDI